MKGDYGRCCLCGAFLTIHDMWHKGTECSDCREQATKRVTTSTLNDNALKSQLESSQAEAASLRSKLEAAEKALIAISRMRCDCVEVGDLRCPACAADKALKDIKK